MTATSPAVTLPPETAPTSDPRNVFNEPAVIKSTIASASDTAAVFPFVVPRLRLIAASFPPMPNNLPEIPLDFHSLAGWSQLAARRLPRLDACDPPDDLSELDDVALLARFAGIHTESSTVTSVSTVVARMNPRDQRTTRMPLHPHYPPSS